MDKLLNVTGMEGAGLKQFRDALRKQGLDDMFAGIEKYMILTRLMGSLAPMEKILLLMMIDLRREVNHLATRFEMMIRLENDILGNDQPERFEPGGS